MSSRTELWHHLIKWENSSSSSYSFLGAFLCSSSIDCWGEGVWVCMNYDELIVFFHEDFFSLFIANLLKFNKPYGRHFSVNIYRFLLLDALYDLFVYFVTGSACFLHFITLTYTYRFHTLFIIFLIFFLFVCCVTKFISFLFFIISV